MVFHSFQTAWYIAVAPLSLIAALHKSLVDQGPSQRLLHLLGWVNTAYFALQYHGLQLLKVADSHRSHAPWSPPLWSLTRLGAEGWPCHDLVIYPIHKTLPSHDAFSTHLARAMHCEWEKRLNSTRSFPLGDAQHANVSLVLRSGFGAMLNCNCRQSICCSVPYLMLP